MIPSPHAFTVHSLRGPAGEKMGSWLHDPATSGRAVYAWAVEALAFHGYAEDEIDWCEADEAIPHDHGKLKATGEVVAVLRHEHIPATQPLSTHERAAKMLEAA